MYTQSYKDTDHNRSTLARKQLIVIDACFEANPPGYETLLAFVETVLAGGGQPNMLAPYCKQLVTMAENHQQLLYLWKLFKFRKMLPRNEWRDLARRIVALDESVETHKIVLELVLEQF